MKKIHLLLGLLLGLLIVFTIAFANNIRSADTITPPAIQPAATSIPPTQDTTPVPTIALGITEQAIQKYARSAVQSQSELGIEISIANFRRNGNEIFVDVCYEMPDNSDWTVDKATLAAGNSVVLPLSGGAGLEFTRSLDDTKKQRTTFDKGSVLVDEYTVFAGTPDYRCDSLSFGPVETGANLSSMKLVIHSLIAIPREGQECQLFLNKVQSALDIQKSGIQIGCSQATGGAKVTIASKPEGMSQAEAETIVAQHTSPAKIQGEWKFDGEIKQ